MSVLSICFLLALPALAAADLDHSSLFDKPISFWKDHLLLANASHAAGGFGLAVLLQRYLADKPFAKPLGWFLVAFALTMHVIAFT